MVDDESDEFSSDAQEDDMDSEVHVVNVRKDTVSKEIQQSTPSQIPGVASPMKSNIKKLQSPKSKEVRIQEYMQSIDSSCVKAHISSTTAHQEDHSIKEKKWQLDAEHEDNDKTVEQSSSSIKGKKTKSDSSSDKGKKKSSQKTSKSNVESAHTDVHEEGGDEKVDESNTPPDGYEKIDDEEFEKIIKGLFQSYQRLH